MALQTLSADARRRCTDGTTSTQAEDSVCKQCRLYLHSLSARRAAILDCEIGAQSLSQNSDFKY